MKTFSFLISVTVMMAMYSACNDPITTGSGLVSNEALFVEGDTIPLSSRTIREDSLQTFIPPAIPDVDPNNEAFLLVGEYQDEEFGGVKSTAYFDVNLFVNFPLGITLDSVVLSMLLDSTVAYGVTDDTHNFSLHRLSNIEQWDRDTFFTNQSLEFDPNPIAELSQSINYTDSIDVFNPNLDSIVREPAQLRFRLPVLDFSAIISDTSNLASNDAFRTAIPGFALTSESQDGSLLGIQIADDSQRYTSFLNFYYTFEDSIKRVFPVVVGSNYHQNIELDREGSDAALAEENDSPELSYIQGLGGYNIGFDLSPLEIYQDRIINFVSLTFFVEERSDVEERPLVEQIFGSFINDDGDPNSILDIFLSPDLLFFGGRIEEQIVDGRTVQAYTVQITNHATAVVNGDIQSNELIISPAEPSRLPNNTIIHGEAAGDLAPYLKVIFTNP